MTENFFDKKSIRHLVFTLGIPAMFGQFFNILYNIVDRVFVGNMKEVGGIALASIGICAPILTAVSAFAYMIGIGASSHMSICLGRKDEKTAEKMPWHALCMLVSVSVVLTIVLFVCRRKLLYLLGCSDAMYPYAEKYFMIYICGTIAALCGIGMNHFILAQGFAKQGMLSVMIGAGVNLILDPVFIYGFHLGIAGAAYATVAAQLCMAVYVFSFLFRSDVPIRLRRITFEKQLAERILAIGFMPFLITILDNFVIMFLNATLRRYGGEALGDELLICATVIQSFLTIVFCPAQGITSGCGTLFSYHYGAGHYEKLRQIFKCVLIVCMVYIGVLEILAQCTPMIFVRLFLQDSSLAGLACGSIRKYTLGLLGVAVQYAFVDGLTAMGKVRYAMPLSFFRKFLYLAFLYIMPHFIRIENIFYAAAFSDIIGASFTLICFYILVLPKLKKELTGRQELS